MARGRATPPASDARAPREEGSAILDLLFGPGEASSRHPSARCTSTACACPDAPGAFVGSRGGSDATFPASARFCRTRKARTGSRRVLEPPGHPPRAGEMVDRLSVAPRRPLLRPYAEMPLPSRTANRGR